MKSFSLSETFVSTVALLRPDGTLLLEIHGIMGGHNLQGNTYLSATTV